MTYNDELVVDAANDAPYLQNTMTTTTADVVKEKGGRRRCGCRDGNEEDEVDDTKWGGGRGGYPAIGYGNDNDDDDDDEDN